MKKDIRQLSELKPPDFGGEVKRQAEITSIIKPLITGSAEEQGLIE